MVLRLMPVNVAAIMGVMASVLDVAWHPYLQRLLMTLLMGWKGFGGYWLCPRLALVALVLRGCSPSSELVVGAHA